MSSDPPGSEHSKKRKVEFPSMFFGARDSLWSSLHQPMNISEMFTMSAPSGSQDAGTSTAPPEVVASSSNTAYSQEGQGEAKFMAVPSPINVKIEEDSSDSVIVCDKVVKEEEPVIDLEAVSSGDGEESVDTVMRDADTADEEEPDAAQEMNQLIRMKNAIISVLKDFVCVVCFKHVDHTFRLCEEYHFFCSNCKPSSCHICDKPIAPSRLHNDFNKLLKAIPKVCKYASNGCRQFHDDNELCGFRHIVCSKCNRNMSVKDAFRHFLVNHGHALSMTKQQTLKVEKFDDKKTARAIYVFNQFFYFTEYFDTKKKRILFTLQVFPIGLPKGEFFLTVKFEKKNEQEIYEKTVKAINMKGDYQRFLYSGEPSQTIVVPFDLVRLFKTDKKEVDFSIIITKQKDQDDADKTA